jgi:hypothetical protein
MFVDPIMSFTNGVSSRVTVCALDLYTLTFAYRTNCESTEGSLNLLLVQIM